MQFGTFNNGTGGISVMVVDVAGLWICGPQPAFQHHLPLILHTGSGPTPTGAPTATPPSTATPHINRNRHALFDAVPYANRNRHALVDADNDSWDHSHRHTGRGANALVAA